MRNAEPVPKRWRGGTHRAVSLDETFARIDRLCSPLGITRLANVTGLDRIGIPVVQAVRPNSRSIAVSQGKGLTPAAAKISALMEAIEGYHAERPTVPLTMGSWSDLGSHHRMVDVLGLPRPTMSRWHDHARILWAPATDLSDGERLLVPYEVVHTDYRLPLPTGSGCFAMTSNGVAAGNHLLEALSHGICELIERDAVSLWVADADTDHRRVDLRTIDDPDCIELVERYDDAGFDVAVWDATTGIGVPVFVVVATDRYDDDLSPTFGAHGYGCHPNREVALSRALTEAAQARLTHIAGSRDDKTPEEYAYGLSAPVRASIAEQTKGRAERRFDDIPTRDFETLNEDVTWMLDQLTEAGFGSVSYVDLTIESVGIPVVRVVAPGLELAGITDTVRFGSRATATARRLAS